MWDEEINKKIKEAADQYHPAYDEEAWGKMEKLLDKHLPQKKDWRRIILPTTVSPITTSPAESQPRTSLPSIPRTFT